MTSGGTTPAPPSTPSTWRPWEIAWQEALYGRAGFYRRPEGPAGHFATSAQGIPGVGELLARAVASLAARHGLRHVVDVGAGRGELLGRLHDLDPGLALTGVDVVERPCALGESVAWVRSPGGPDLPGLPLREPVLVVAHEWLDVVPAPVVELDEGGSWRLVEVAGDGTERLGDAPAEADLAWLTAHWPSPGEAGARAEVGRARDGAWDSLCDKVSCGLVVAVDYGHERSSRPPFGSLTAFRDGHEVAAVPDGSCDLTAHVAVDSLAHDRRLRQADLFGELGLGTATPAYDLARSDPQAYLRALAARSAFAAATARPGLGDFWWVLREV